MLDFGFDNSYARLPDRFYTRLGPTPVAEPKLIALNDALARDLGLDPAELRGEEGVSILAGNTVPDGAEPIAQVYAGHQFGGWSPQLGDGRAILLGEVVGGGGRRDIQLKGSGPTPYSRMGDGRAWLGPVLREYIVSEAMHALGVRTTRALAAVATGEPVFREEPLPGAILARVARSHIRVGTFQFFAARGDQEALKGLTDHVLERHYPGAYGIIDLLHRVVGAQAELIASWMSLGFIHGVMNTDNMSIAGETIDYGPCAFMDDHHSAAVFSSIDHHGRYAYSNQPTIAYWNLAQFCSCLLPLMVGELDAKVEAATDVLKRFAPMFQNAWIHRFRAKLGLLTEEAGDFELASDLLSRMERNRADFTNTFRSLPDARGGFDDPAAFDEWARGWRLRLGREGASPEDRVDLMREANPALIPRNHRVEEAISAARRGDLDPFRRLSAALETPFADPGGNADLARPPTEEERVRETFCGT